MNFLSTKKTEPCKVCGESSSSGWHCGTITCEACKKFFLRNIGGEYQEFKCTRSTSSCVITKQTRTTCAYCRFQKCLQVGMKINEKCSIDSAVSFNKIPCSVCSDDSSGLHFGAITCEGCKGFFRRNVNESKKFVCASKGNCEISYKTRNACKACRFRCCVEVGMDLNNCKIGRQSNLFKQNLKSAIDNKANQISNPNYNSVHPNNQINSEMSQSLIYNSLHFTNVGASSTEINVEDSLDDRTKVLVKKIYEQYKILESNSLSNLSYQNQNQNYQSYQDFEVGLEFIKNHTGNCIHFLSNAFLEKFGRSDEGVADQKRILVNSIHPIRLLQIAKCSTYANYFDWDNQAFERIVRYFPVFNQITPYFKALIENIRELKLDNKEFALFTAFIAFSTSCKGLSNVMVCFDCNLEICKALTKYMVSRRNEAESSEQLINLAFRFEKLNLCIQNGLLEKCKDAKQRGYKFDPFYEQIIFQTFSKPI